MTEGSVTDGDEALTPEPTQLCPGSGLYVDVENLQSDGQAMIEGLMEDWPAAAPAPSRLCLYVRADLVELWRGWATNRFRDLVVVVSGTQHFSLSSSKNSADIAIATNAITDLVLGRVAHVVVLSDDSDFMSLYVSIREEPQCSRHGDTVPFLWVVSDREGTVSATIRQFFPPAQLHVISASQGPPKKVVASTSKGAKVTETRLAAATDSWTEIAKAVLEEIPVGTFKSTDCRAAIKKRFPQHPFANAAGPSFGSDFKNNVWPILESRGVKIKNPGKNPVQYEMTPEAKSALG